MNNIHQKLSKVKAINLLIICVFLFALSLCNEIRAQSCDLFISEYLEGSSSNKALEIYNPLESAVDLSNYVVYRFNNGTVPAVDSIFPQGTLLSGEVFVIVNPSSSAAILAKKDTTHTVTFFNGDDAIVLINTSTMDTLDIIGEVGVDPGTGWTVGAGATNNFTLVRKDSINKGNTNWVVSATEWDVFPIDFADSLGSHSVLFHCEINVWDGSASSDWFTADNWSHNHVPNLNEGVLIPNGSVVIIPNGMMAEAFQVEVETNAVLTVDGELTVQIN